MKRRKKTWQEKESMLILLNNLANCTGLFMEERILETREKLVFFPILNCYILV